MNRITAAIARMEKQIADRIAKGLTTQEKVDALHATLDMDILEHARFQEMKSLAVAEGQDQHRRRADPLRPARQHCHHLQPPAGRGQEVPTSFFGELLKLRLGKKTA